MLFGLHEFSSLSTQRLLGFDRNIFPEVEIDVMDFFNQAEPSRLSWEAIADPQLSLDPTENAFIPRLS